MIDWYQRIFEARWLESGFAFLTYDTNIIVRVRQFVRLTPDSVATGARETQV